MKADRNAASMATAPITVLWGGVVKGATSSGMVLTLLCCTFVRGAEPPESPRIKGQAVAVGAIIADRHVPDSAWDVHRRAMSLGAVERYEFLSQWVLPSDTHNTIRADVDFTPTHPAPPVSQRNATDEARIELARQRGLTRVQTGGNLVAPALDLIAAARELGRLDEVRSAVEQTVPHTESQQRARLALLALIAIEVADFDTAHRHLDALYPLIEANEASTFPARAAELLAIHGAMTHPPTRGFARDAAANLFVRIVRAPRRGPAVAWESHLMAMMAAIRHFDQQADENAESSAYEVEMSLAPQLAEWSPSSHTTAESRGTGHARPHWQRANERIANTHSHQDDLLYYHIPLQGNFQVECDVQTRDFQNTQLVVGGHWAESLYYSLDKFEHGDLRARLARADVEPKLTKYQDWAHMRTTVVDRTISQYVNGRLLRRVEVTGEIDPWIVLLSDNRKDGSAVDIRITGEAIIPEELRLSASNDLTGWFPYFGSPVGKPDALWQQLGDPESGGGILGKRRADLAGQHAERLLRYHRPMFEDGTIEYEFFYHEGEVHAHPALDRMAFLLEPDGVQIHWVTDGQYDRTTLAPDNEFEEPAARRGPRELPLRANAWNRLRLTLVRDTVSLHLNDQLIYERELELTNQRTLGLFHYADRTEARVRNVRWRGSWPRELPSVTQQGLASKAPYQLDESRSTLKGVFEHDFSEGLPGDKVSLVSPEGTTITQTSTGVRIDRPGGQGYRHTGIAPNVLVAGDFDFTARFSRFAPRLSEDTISTIGIRVQTGDEKPQQIVLLRRFLREPKQEDRHLVQAVVRNATVGTEFDWNTVYSDAQESESGRLRIARRGNRAYFLIAEEDSPNFRLVGEAEVKTGMIPRDGIQLLMQTKGECVASVEWTDCLLRAENLTLRPPSDAPLDRALSVMNADGTGLRQLLPKDSGIASPGSPAWSADGKRIAFDDYRGSTESSRIYVINADGSNLRDLGIGNMPTFSPDGQRIAFSWGGQGVAVMNADGTDREVLDASGWGAQWSPDGRSIAYGKSGNVTVFDLQSKRQRQLLEGEHASRYSYIYWNLGWSRDSQRVCFKARTRENNQFEIAVAPVAGSGRDFQILHASPQEMNADFSWHPDGNRVLFSVRVGGALRLVMLDRRNRRPPDLLPGQPLNHLVTGADWSPDGQQIAFSSQVSPD